LREKPENVLHLLLRKFDTRVSKKHDIFKKLNISCVKRFTSKTQDYFTTHWGGVGGGGHILGLFLELAGAYSNLFS
jgi:hypothetical protein